jgi:dihydroflavonol-4-reductase
MNDKVLVMGASGFLGSHVAKALAEQKRDIRIFTRQNSNISAIKHLDFEHVYGDVSDKGSVEQALKGCSVVYYCVVNAKAWTKNVKLLRKTNVDGLRNVMDAAMAKGVERFIYTSTFMTIGLNPSGIANEKDEFNWREEAPEYVKVRVDAEDLFFEYCKKGLPGVACNVAMTYGPYDTEPTLHGKVLGLVARGQFPFYWDCNFSSVGIQDAADAMLLAEVNGRIGERYLITEKLLPLREIFKIAADSAGVKRHPFRLPMSLMYASCVLYEILAWFRKRETAFTFVNFQLSRKTKDFDNSKALKELKWKPRPVEEVIAEAAQWFISDDCNCGDLNILNL